MPLTFTSPTLVNTTELTATQRSAVTLGLSNGGVAVFWNNQTFSASDGARLQIYDGAGNLVTGVVNFPAMVGANNLDMVEGSDGSIYFAVSGALVATPADTRVFLYKFQPGVSSQPQLLSALNYSPFGFVGNPLQLVLTPGASDKIQIVAQVTDVLGRADYVSATYDSVAGLQSGPTLVVNDSMTTGVYSFYEAIGSANGSLFFVDGNGGSFNQAHGTDNLGYFAYNLRDAINMPDGTILLAGQPLQSPNVLLSWQYGDGVRNGTLSGLSYFNSSINAFPGTTTTGAQTFDIELLSLGNNRVMVVWVADGGDSFPLSGVIAEDGIYATVLDLATGALDAAVLIKGFGVGSNDPTLSAIELSADLMADGRVSVTWNARTFLTDYDVFRTVVDPRVAGVSVAATSGTDTYLGTAWDDTFTGIDGADSVDGGGGNDTVVFSGLSLSGFQVDLDQPQSFPATFLRLSGIENLTGWLGDDEFRGSAGANVLLGNSGADTLIGRGGNDTLGGGANDDLLKGDAGNDQLDGGDGSDTLSGGGGDDVLSGGIGNDLIRADAGNDVVNGDAGNDRIQAGAGDDTVNGGDNNDVIDGDDGDDLLIGGLGNDTIRADAGADTVQGGQGNDVIRAGSGVLVVDGGVGVDTLVLTDRSFPAGNAGIHADLTGDFDLLGLADAYQGFEASVSGIENVTGTSGNDFLGGDALANVLRGGRGDDVLLSRAGADTLVGGLGADSFVFQASGGGADTISDFEMAVDRILLVQGGFGDIGPGNLAARLQINATGAVAANGLAQLTFDNAGPGFGTLAYDADGNGAGAAVTLAILVPTTGEAVALTLANFAFL